MPASVRYLWDRVDVSIALAMGGGPSARWERLVVLLRHFLEQWDTQHYEKWSSGAAVHRRFGWMCAVPGCTVRRNLESHHIAFRSQGGTDDTANLASLCAGHHRAGLHAGSSLRVHGRAPAALEWRLPYIHAIGDVLQDVLQPG